MDAVETVAGVNSIAPTFEYLNQRVGEAGRVPARNALVEWCYPDVCALLDRFGRGEQLAAHYREDARQEILCALVKLLDGYATTQETPTGCEFHEFLEAFVLGRFLNFVRALRRRENRMDRSTPIEEMLERASLQAMNKQADDPAELAAKRELRTRLEEAVPRLDASMRQLWDELDSGHSFRASAAALGLSYYQVRRLCKKMIDLLRDRLTDGTDKPRGVPGGGHRACE